MIQRTNCYQQRYQWWYWAASLVQRGGRWFTKNRNLLSSPMASFCMSHSPFCPPGGQGISKRYNQADGSLSVVLPTVVLDGISGSRERGGSFTGNSKGYTGTYYYCSGASRRFLVTSGAVRPPDAPLAVDACNTHLYAMLQG